MFNKTSTSALGFALASTVLVSSAFLVRPASAQCWSTHIGQPGANGGVSCFASLGSDLYAGGSFTSINGVAANRVARWDGTTWSALGAGVGGTVSALAVFDDGSGAALYAAGSFLTAGGNPAARIARWDGSTWTALGAGLPRDIYSLVVHDDGSGIGPALFAAGSAPSPTALARWTSAGWSFGATYTGLVNDLCVFDDGHGSGPQLYAGGQDLNGTGQMVIRWDGSAWSNLPAGGPFSPYIDEMVGALCVFDDGNSRALYVAGNWFSGPQGSLARFDGIQWSAVGSAAFARGKGLWLNDMVVHDEGNGPSLYVTGTFNSFGDDHSVHGLASWNGALWDFSSSSLEGGVGEALASHSDAGGAALFVGGGFTSAGGVPSKYVARWTETGGVPLIGSISGPASAMVGDTVSCTVTASGVGPLTYQWRRGAVPLTDNGPVSGATTDTLTLQIVSTSPSNNYSVLVSSQCGSTLSTQLAISVDAGPGTPVCPGEGIGCPCGNASPPSSTQGCANSLGAFGWLVAQGDASVANDTLTLTSANTNDAFVLFIQGTSEVTPFAVNLGDGLRCAGGTITRLGVKIASGGVAQHPAPGDLTLSAAGGLAGGETIVYQAVYRDAAPFCTSGTFNLTNGVSVVWTP